MTYVGSLTIPFRDFSFVIKVQSEEHGITGMRETSLLTRRVVAGEELSFENGRMKLPDWNPDEEQFDAEFRMHPLSRVRRVLRDATNFLAIEAAITCLPGFTLPEAADER